jgi:tRNA wybutosine-synthesizing protein 1
VDRSLFLDYWERFLVYIDELSKKGQRTVFRLTLIKGWNIEEARYPPLPLSSLSLFSIS